MLKVFVSILIFGFMTVASQAATKGTFECLLNRGHSCDPEDCKRDDISAQVTIDLAQKSFRYCDEKDGKPKCVNESMQIDVQSDEITGIEVYKSYPSRRMFVIDRTNGAIMSVVVFSPLQVVVTHFGNCDVGN